MAVLKFILYFLLFYYGAKILLRMLFPVVVRKTVKNFEEKIRAQQQRQQEYQETPPDGRVKVEYTPPQKSKVVEDDDYIEFEEVN